jgi:hypothetical protein
MDNTLPQGPISPIKIDESVNQATDCAFTHESGDTMTTDEYEKLPAVDRKHLMECPECREILSLEELLLHLAYKHSSFRL